MRGNEVEALIILGVRDGGDRLSWSALAVSKLVENLQQPWLRVWMSVLDGDVSQSSRVPKFSNRGRSSDE